jgi:hypothetical protein
MSSEQLRKLAEKLVAENSLEQKTIEFINNVEKLAQFISSHTNASAATKRLIAENITPRIFQAREALRLCSAIDQAFALGNHEAVLLAINVILIESRTNDTPLNLLCLDRVANILNSIATQDTLDAALIELTRTVANNLLQQTLITTQQRSLVTQSILPALENLQYKQYFNKALQQASPFAQSFIPPQSYSAQGTKTAQQAQHLMLADLPAKRPEPQEPEQRSLKNFLTQ